MCWRDKTILSQDIFYFHYDLRKINAVKQFSFTTNHTFFTNPINFHSFSIPLDYHSEEEEGNAGEGKVGEQRYIKAKVHQSPESSGSRHSSKEPSPIKSKCLIG